MPSWSSSGSRSGELEVGLNDDWTQVAVGDECDMGLVESSLAKFRNVQAGIG
jgi:hypothetical protein